MKQKIQALLNQLNHGLVEREETLKTALLTVLAGENLVLIGPPGTGKSMLARRIADGFEHDDGDKNVHGYFEYLLTKFSTPEEIFGPLSITELKQDRFKRNTAGYLPTVKMAFLDEIFKASSSILNALLTILNERIYHNGAEPQRVPMRALIAASNELPTDQEELSALYDRFLVRSFVGYVKPENLKRLFERTGIAPELSKLTTADLDRIQHNTQSIDIPEDVINAILCIWEQHKEAFKEDRRESLSDRRLKKVLHLLRVSAATNGRSEVDLSDVFLLKDCLWNHQENAIKVRDLILKTLRTFSHTVAQDKESTLAPHTPKPLQTIQKNKIKGFKGSGTAQDPLLIESLQGLMDLSRPEVGLQGYYFRQTTDIDCSELTHWTDIDFKGHYDGGEFTIKHGGFMNKYYNAVKNLFKDIQAQSSVSNLKLNNLRLANTVEGSQIVHCVSNLDLINATATNCSITACKAGQSLILDSALKCKITCCQSGSILIKEVASYCKISDCLVVPYYQGREGEYRGGVAKVISNGSVVERCFVTGECIYSGSGYFYFSGISNECTASTIRECALGKLKRSTTDVRLANRITRLLNNGKLENNASIDSNEGADDRNGVDGATIAAALFKQHYFENTLNWDFGTIWQWDNTENRPALRTQSIGITTPQTSPTTQQAGMVDLLTQQMRANIWL